MIEVLGRKSAIGYGYAVPAGVAPRQAITCESRPGTIALDLGGNLFRDEGVAIAYYDTACQTITVAK